ncbi:MAG: ABC transporter ATP-binding protein [Limnochordia bacterium]
MLKLIRFLKPHWIIALIAPLLMLLEVVMDLYQPKLMTTIIDQGVALGNVPLIVSTGVKMIAVAAVSFIGGFGCTAAASVASYRFGTDLRDALFRKIQEFSFANLDQFKTSSLIIRLTNDVTIVQNTVLMSLRMMVRAPLMAAGGLAMALSLNLSLASVLVVAIPVLAAAMAVIIRVGFPYFRLVQEKLDRVNTVTRENLAGVRVVKAFVRSEWENQRFAAANDDLIDTSVKAFKIVALAMPLVMLILNFTVVAILWFGGIMINQDQILVGEVLAFTNYTMMILMSVMSVAFILMSLSRSKASGERLAEVLEAQVDISTSPNPASIAPTEGRVEFRDVSFRYPYSQGRPVLENISFTAEPGQTVAIVGETGSGKSTLVSLIPRLYDVTSGAVLIDGHDVRTMDLEKLREKIGFVLQDTILFSGTIKENLMWGNENADLSEVVAKAEAACAHDFITSFPAGYETVLGQRGVNLSGGQKQRISIARALMKNPVILILDDSTSAVDLATEARIQRALRRETKNCTTFIIAQRISSVMDADKIIVLEQGSIAGVGTHQELLESNRVYQEIYYSQINQEVAVND